jgi:hypothetical protein
MIKASQSIPRNSGGTFGAKNEIGGEPPGGVPPFDGLAEDLTAVCVPFACPEAGVAAAGVPWAPLAGFDLSFCGFDLSLFIANQKSIAV